MAHVMGEMEVELIFTDTLVVISPFLALSISAIKKIGDDILPDDHLFHADDEPDDHLLNFDDKADDRLLHADHLLNPDDRSAPKYCQRSTSMGLTIDLIFDIVVI